MDTYLASSLDFHACTLHSTNVKLLFLYVSLWGLLRSFFFRPFRKIFLLFTQIDHFDYRNHFVYPPIDLWCLELLRLTPDKTHEMSFQLGLANWAIVIVSALVTLRLYRRPTVLFGISGHCFLNFHDVAGLDFCGVACHDLSSSISVAIIGIITALLPLLYLELVDYFVKVNKSRILVIFSVFLVVLAQYNFGIMVGLLNGSIRRNFSRFIMNT